MEKHLPPYGPQTPYPADQGMQKKDQTFTKGTVILQEPLSRTL